MADLKFPYTSRACFLPAHELLAKPSTRALVLTCGRRVGKSTLGAAALVMGAMHRSGDYAWVSPLRQVSKAVGWPLLKTLLRDVPGVEWRQGDLTVTIPTIDGRTSTIGMYSAADDDSGSGVRGREFIGIYVDEVAQIGAQDFWSALWPTQANVKNPWLIAAGTPRGEDLLLDLHRMAGETPGWHSFVIPASESGVYSKEELDTLRNTMPGNQYLREMEARFDVGAPDQLIRLEDVMAAQERIAPERLAKGLDDSHPRIVGVDVALKADESVIARRHGPHALEPIRIKNPTTTELAYRILAVVRDWNADGLFIDAGSMGASVIDICRQLGLNPIPVDFGGRAMNPERYANKRAEMLDAVRAWVEQPDAVLPKGLYVTKQLTVSRFEINAQNRLQIEPKKSIRKRLGGGASTDYLDSLACTFAAKVPNPRLKDRYTLFSNAVEYGADGSKYYKRAESRRDPNAAEEFDPYDERYEEFDPYSDGPIYSTETAHNTNW